MALAPSLLGFRREESGLRSPRSRARARCGSTPEGTARKKTRKDDDIEPFSWWSVSQQCLEEIIHYDVRGVIDASAGDMQLARTCMLNEIPYVGICYNELHVKEGYKYLYAAIFNEFIGKPSNKLYDAELEKC